MVDLVFDANGAPALKDAPTNEPVKPQEQPVWRPDTQRRRDAVVDAARSLDDLSPDGVRELLTRRWQGRRALEESDVEAFSRDARARRIDDLSDALDHRIRGSTMGRTREAHVSLPRGFARRALKALDDSEVKQIADRLRGRGWTIEQIKRHVRSIDRGQRIASALQAGLTQKPTGS